ncbi:PTS sugar transporter subunit IIA [Granulicatella seriolae]|uniref:Ascorbate-specific PTS system EIIA component n=1 Tax=Granulicatella seriolae TaxID=2967226 RepID=A0ABT1WLC8_9LACT|nr:PTS sugar transporter subunit IIA [Granulicatella seriolae]
MLRELLSVDMIQLNQRAEDWRQAIRIAAKPLEISGKITQKYTDKIIEIVDEIGPYIVITKHVALPHAPVTDGALAIGLSITTLETPVEFGSLENDPVKFLFCISAVDNSSHLEMLAELIVLLEQEDFLTTMASAKDEEQVLKYIEEIIKGNEDK